MVYIFIGQDNPAKEAQLKKIKQEYLAKDLEQFNLDVIYAREAKLKAIQEVFLNLPVKAGKRVVLIKDAAALAKDCQEFIRRYLSAESAQIVLVMEFEHFDRKDDFLNSVLAHGKVMRFKEVAQDDTFSLLRQIESGQIAPALGILTRLLKDGERPERILGGLRYSWEKQSGVSAQNKRRLLALLHCDIDIKKGRLKPAFALEKLVIDLCAFTKPAH
jgi:DNA polymerase III delta subunit